MKTFFNLVQRRERRLTDAANPGPARPGLARLEYVDGLRAVAILLVLCHHSWQSTGGAAFGHLHGHALHIEELFRLAHTGVNLFLVLSGFCLYWPFVSRPGYGGPTLWEFAKRRCRRILPPYYVALTLSGGVALVAALLHPGGDSLRRVADAVLWHAAMIHNLRPDYVLSLNPPFWSLALECDLYVLFPLLVEAFRRFGPRPVLWCVLLATSIFRMALVRGHLLPDLETGYTLAYSVFGRAFEFTGGMFAAALTASVLDGRPLTLRKTDWGLVLVVVALAVATSRYGGLNYNGGLWFLPMADAVIGVGFLAVLLAAGSTSGTLRQALSHPLLVHLGVFSYSIYLIHFPLVMWSGQWLSRRMSHQAAAVVEIFVACPIFMMLSYIFFLVFERPFLVKRKDETLAETARDAAHSPAP